MSEFIDKVKDVLHIGQDKAEAAEGTMKDKVDEIKDAAMAKLDADKDGKLELDDAKAVADVNKDGAVNVADAKAALDVDKDGDVDIADAKAAFKDMTDGK
jgi:hypothetical protein